MKEIKCPHCHTMFTVDDADYASIVNQVRNAEFEADLQRRLEDLEKTKDAERQNAVLQAENDFQKTLNQRDSELSRKDEELAKLKAQVAGAAQLKQIELNDVISRKDQEIAALKEQVKSIAQTTQNDMNSKLSVKDQEIAALREQVSTIAKSTEKDMSIKLSEKDQEIIRLQSAISNSDREKQLAILEERNKATEQLSQKEQTIVKLEGEVKAAENDKTLALTTMKDRYDFILKQKDEEVERYREMKSKMSTKMVGESLEVYCHNEFNKNRMMSFPNAFFDKDNDASGGSKGDFIFRDYIDGKEYISIMFEMKNEMETTATKHKNEDFYAKLDKDRKAKGCEYAVLVSLLEADNDYFNQGIVDVSWQYDKMFVIRPQFFLPLIGLLSQASKKAVKYELQLKELQQQSMDVTHFEEKVDKFKDNFMRHATDAVEKHNKSIKEIDKIIKELEKMKGFLSGSNKAYGMAIKDTESLTIRSLTYKNPTMKAAFEEARKAKADDNETIDLEE